MKRIISLFAFVSLLTAAIMLCGCGKEERAVLNYEQPVATMVTAAQYGDTQSYLSCFTPEAKAEYTAGEDYNPDLAQTLLTRGDKDAVFSYKLGDKKELDSAEIKTLQETYKKSYHKNVSFKKAFTMEVSFVEELEDKSLTDKREITVVKIDNNWYIFGSVIEGFDLK